MTHILFYDGVCGFCDRLVRFALAHDREGRFRFAPLQGEFARRALAAYHRDADDLDTVYLIANHGKADERLLWRSEAILFLLDELGWPWKAAFLASPLPTLLLDLAYDLFAANRYRLFGRFESCRVPRPNERERFMDAGGN